VLDPENGVTPYYGTIYENSVSDRFGSKMNGKRHCCGSRSAWVHIHFAVLYSDLDLYWECRSGSGARSMDIAQNLQNKTGVWLLKRLLYLVGMFFFYLLPNLSIFVMQKFNFFVTLKSDQDTDSHGSALVWLLDPDSH
jgi:hypothetical protein